MIAGVLLAPVIALIVWVVGNHYGIEIGYWQAVVYVLVAKVIAMYLKTDVHVELNVVKAKEEAEE